ncbi:YggT family protein [Sphingomonas canadensis]|uniref:YggT family protein n=1 Tax=Sphingomonas canadensis TaxID=1219257 RepID=A0ABW3H0Z9_9SPHN|nr:YggT family protein [Sphingomonas canadensis]MCW3834959.1 YggT family protein [Sphingomonas canadensis]
MGVLLEIIQILLNVLWWIIVGQAILSWLLAFNVISLYNDTVRGLWFGLARLTEPLYAPIRRIMPDFGPLDLSPLVVLILIAILGNVIIPAIGQQLAI